MRTGSVAMFQIMREIAESFEQGYAPVLPLNHEMETWEKNVDEWANTNLWVVLKLHRWIPLLEPYVELEASRARVVMTIRDIRDVAVSLMHFRDDTFEGVLNSRVLRGNIEGQAEWEAKVPSANLLKIRYEDFMADRTATTQKVAYHMGATLFPAFAATVQKKWTIGANLARSARDYPEDHPEYMNKRHIYKGAIGYWKEQLSTNQVRQIEDLVGEEWFIENGYELS